MPSYEPFPAQCPHDMPEHFYASLKRYVERGTQPGQFLQAVLSNDLREAVGRADAEAMASLRRFVQFCHCDLPSPCWGNQTKVQEWLQGEHENWTSIGLG